MKAGWQTKTLGEVLRKTETVNPLLSPEAEFDYIDVSSVSNQTFRIEETQRLKGADAPSRARRLVKSDDVIFATVRPTLQRIAVVPEELDHQVCSTGYFVLRPRPELEHRFVFYFLFSEDFMGQMEKLQKGASYPAVTDGEVRAQKIPVPPLPEQQRIVGILDEAFNGIATAKANAEKNLQNARAVFDSHLEAVFSQRGEGWVKKRLREVAESVSTGPFGTMLHKSDYVQEGIPLVNPMNIVASRIVPSSRMMVSEETRERLRGYVLKPGDIVIGRRGELGRCALVTDNEAGWLCGTGSFFLRLSDLMDGKFFVALFGSEQFKSLLESSSVGTTMSSLNHNILNDLPIFVPPLAEQRMIMVKVDKMLYQVKRLEAIYRQKLAALEELKKALLHQAFVGEL